MVAATAPRKPRVRKPKVVAPVAPALNDTTGITNSTDLINPPAKPKRVRKPKVMAPVTPAVPEVVEPIGEPVLVLNSPTPAAEPEVTALVPASPVDLSEDKEKEDFARLEEIVRKGLRIFWDVGNALKEISDRKLFRHDGFLSFEDYISVRWNLDSRQRGHQLIEASDVVNALSAYYEANPGEHPFLPLVESHARGMSKLLGRPEKLAEAWDKIVATAPIKHGAPHITGAHVEAVVREVMGITPNPGTGPGEQNPTPRTLPAPPVVPPPTVTLPADTEPPAAIAPPLGQQPDPIEGVPTEIPVAEIEVLTQGEKVVLTPLVALEKVITALKLGQFSHKDPLIVTLLDEVGAGIGAWFDSETDAVEWQAYAPGKEAN